MCRVDKDSNNMDLHKNLRRTCVIAVLFALHGTALYFEEDDDALFGVVGGAVTFCFEPAWGSHLFG